MTTIHQKIKADHVAARKANDKVAALFLGSLLGDLEQTTFKTSGKTDLATDEDATKVLKSYEKKTDEFLAMTIPDIKREQLEAEKVIIAKYLPTQLTEDAIRTIFEENKLTDMKERMAFLKKNYAGQYDGKLASKVAKES